MNKNSDGKIIRLNKFIAQSGLCSRREADNLILKGQDSKYIRIFNIEGRLILDELLSNNNRINVGHFDSGMYLIELEDSFGIKTNKKIIIN